MCKRSSWLEQPLKPVSQKLSLLGSPTKGTQGKFDLSTKIQTWNMDEQALSVALEAPRKGQFITILESESKEPKLTFSS
jgi:hypothetical protein